MVIRGALVLAAVAALLSPVPTAQAADVPTAVSPTVPTAGSLAAPREDDVLTTGEQLLPGDALVSPSGRYRLEVGPDGVSLVERPSWLDPEERTRASLAGPGVLSATLQADGNLVFLFPGGNAYGVGTEGSGATALRLQDDRNLVLFDAAGRVVAQLGTYRRDVLEPGDVLLPGDSVAGVGDASRLVMQGDGNLVLYRGGAAVWSTRTQGHPGAGAILQEDDNLVVYTDEAQGLVPVWDSRTVGVFGPGSALTLVPSPTVLGGVLRVEADVVRLERAVRVCCPIPKQVIPITVPESAWASTWDTSTVGPGHTLLVGDRRRSPDGRCTLLAQADGNLVTYCDGRAVWSAGVPVLPTGSSLFSTRTVVQGDGNVVAYHLLLGTAEVPGWNTGTRVPGSTLVMQDDRNLVLYAPGGRALWSSRTGRL